MLQNKGLITRWAGIFNDYFMERLCAFLLLVYIIHSHEIKAITHFIKKIYIIILIIIQQHVAFHFFFFSFFSFWEIKMSTEACTFYSHHRKTTGATIFVLKNSCRLLVPKFYGLKVNAIKVESFYFYFFFSFFWVSIIKVVNWVTIIGVLI